jgi:glycerol-3-phosphate acyltransferase PlsY
MSTGVTYLVLFVIGYLSGSIMFAYIITKLVAGTDIRNLGNKNPGAANTFKNVGPFWGIFAGLLDALKAVVPILIGHYFFDLSSISLGVIGFGAVIGHGHPIFFGLNGGRAAGTLMGIYIFFIPFELLAAFVVVPIIVFTIVKTNRSYWAPFGIISLSATLSLILNHPVEVKIIVVSVAVLGLFLNRFYLPQMVKNLITKREE